MAAQIGTMKVTEQVDALRTLATHPVDYLVVPRVLATFVSLPLLTIESIFIGILAGYVVGVYLLGIDHERLSYKFQGLDARLTGVEETRIVSEILNHA